MGLCRVHKENDGEENLHRKRKNKVLHNHPLIRFQRVERCKICQKVEDLIEIKTEIQ